MSVKRTARKLAESTEVLDVLSLSTLNKGDLRSCSKGNQTTQRVTSCKKWQSFSRNTHPVHRRIKDYTDHGDAQDRHAWPRDTRASQSRLNAGTRINNSRVNRNLSSPMKHRQETEQD